MTEFLLSQMTFTIDFSAVATSIITAAILGLAGLVARTNSILNKIVGQIGTTHPPEGMLGRISKTESELYELREWAIRSGYDRRSHQEVKTS